MNGNVDSHFMIGRTHSICQDYAEASLQGEPTVIVSDGCSSAAHTDFGSRFLVRAAKRALDRYSKDYDSYVNRVADCSIITADGYRRAMGLPIECLCATLLTAHLSKDVIRTTIFGDGVVAARERDTGRITVDKYEYPSGAPYYLRYTLDQSHNDYVDQFGFEFRISSYYIHPDGKTDQKTEWTTEKVEHAGAGSIYHVNDYDLVALFTDGVHSFVRPEITSTSKTEKQVNFLDVVRELLQFKNYNGIFAERRMKRAFDPLLGAFGKHGWINTDDLSMGVIYHEGAGDVRPGPAI